MSDHVAAFIDFLRANGIGPAESREIIPDDVIRRYRVDGDPRGKRNGTYRLMITGDSAVGWARSHKMDRTFKFSSGLAKTLSPAERAALDADMARRKADNEAAIAARQAAVAMDAQRIWNEAGDPPRRRKPPPPHPYIVRKGIDMDGARLWRNQIILPMLDPISGCMWNLQTIAADGTKRFMPGGRVTGLYTPVGRLTILKARPFIFAEGWATAKSLRAASDCPVVCTFNAGNIMAVARGFRRRYRYAEFIFAEDFDQWTMMPRHYRAAGIEADQLRAIPGDDPAWRVWRAAGYLMNTGHEKARQAARAVAGRTIAIPDEYITHPDKPTDFNDLQKIVGPEMLRRLVRGLLHGGESCNDSKKTTTKGGTI